MIRVNLGALTTV